MHTYFKPENAFQILCDHHDTIVTVVFIKRTTGELRTLNGTLNCKKYVNGRGMSYNPADKNLCTIFDLAIAKTLPEAQRNKAYRMVNLEMVTEIRAGGKVYRP